MFPNLKIELTSREDKHENVFYIGKAQAPCSIELKNGLAIFVFIADPQQEMLHFACVKPGSKFSRLKKVYANSKVEKFIVPLAKKSDVDGKIYYMAIIQDQKEIVKLHNGATFIVFTSKEGSEQLQIMENTEASTSDDDVEILTNCRSKHYFPE